jgi:hypothetical protein
MDLHLHCIHIFISVIATSLITVILSLSINVQQLAPVPCFRFQTKLRHSASGDKSHLVN